MRDKTYLPQYKCNKVVRAAKITDITYPIDEPKDKAANADEKWAILILKLETRGTALVEVTFNYCLKHKPEIGGYYVVYEDGYQSFSPAEAFESGYTLLRD